MCHLHPLHFIILQIIINYNKAIVLFNNFCAVLHLPSRYKGLCRLNVRNGIVLCVLEVKRRKGKIIVKLKSWLGKIHSHCSSFLNSIFCYANRKQFIIIIQISVHRQGAM